MSLNAASSNISAKMSQIANVLLGTKSTYSPTGSQALTPTDRDGTVFTQQTNGVTNPPWIANNKLVYPLPKTANLIGQIWHEVTLSAAQTNPAFTPAVPINFNTNTAASVAVGVPRAAYCQNVGDLIYDLILHRYGTVVAQQFRGEFLVWRRSLIYNNINIQHINAEVLGNLPPGGNSEQTRINALYQGVTLRCPLDFLWFVMAQDKYWMPEAYAAESTLELTLRPIQDCLYTTSGTNAEFTGGASALPTITNCILRYDQITLSAAEKMNRLTLYKQPDGLTYLFQDVEEQLGQLFTPAAAAGTEVVLNVPLSNFRMDSAAIMFVVRIASTQAPFAPIAGAYTGQLQPFKSDRCQADRSTASIVSLNAIGTQVPVNSYKFQANGKDLYNEIPELLARTVERKKYHPDAEIGNFVYEHSFAIYPEDSKNATGTISPSVLGQLTLVIKITSLGPGVTFQVDAYNLAMNLNQSRAGGFAKVLN